MHFGQRIDTQRWSTMYHRATNTMGRSLKKEDRRHVTHRAPGESVVRTDEPEQDR
jgi:hypothetical protein